MTVIKVAGLAKTYATKQSWFGAPRAGLQAVRPMSFDVGGAETLGIVGESGCGKSTLARMLVGLLRPTQGRIEIDGQLLDKPDPAAFGRLIQYVFQDPAGSLNPRKTIEQILQVPLQRLQRLPAGARRERISQLLDAVNLREDCLSRYPHEFSGGQAQRIGIARALAAGSKIMVLDEPVSALDVSVQAQVLNLLADLKSQYGLTYLFISHDLAVVEAISDRIMVLYFGSLVETGPAARVFTKPRHPYTRLLADSAPVVGRALADHNSAEELPDPLNPPPGCAFAGRCPRAREQCRSQMPALKPIGADQFVACHFPLEE